MEKMITFDCMFLECGRKFNTEDLLESHVKRRHPDSYKDRYPNKINENSDKIEKKNPNKILSELENKIKEIENNKILINETEEEIKLDLPHLELYGDETESDNETEDNNDTITDEMLLIGGKYFQYEEIDEVILKIIS